jgi:hypothetical protein
MIKQGLPEINLILSSSCIQFWLFSVTPKYLNSAIHSKDENIFFYCDLALHSTHNFFIVYF